MSRTEELLTEIRDLLSQLLELARAANPAAAKAIGGRFEGIFKPLPGTSDSTEAVRWGPKS